MQTQLQPQPTDYAKAVAGLVAQMPLERAVQVYEFVRFLQNQPSFPPPIVDDEGDWLNDSEEEMQKEDKAWEEMRTHQREKFSLLTKNAQDEIAAGSTQPMFTQNRKFIPR